MNPPIEWPGEWRTEPPTIAEHAGGRELAWLVRGYPFTRPVLARSNVGVRRLKTEHKSYGPFVFFELLADGFHRTPLEPESMPGLEWNGPLLMPWS